jgi:hypothetical protein
MSADWISRRGIPVLLAVCLLALCAGQAGARSPAINDIQPYDTIFIYEEGLNLTQLRNATTDNPITALNRYQNDDPEQSIVTTIPVVDDTDFTVQAILVNGAYGTYYAFNPTDGATYPVFIREPQLFLDVVLASPNHNEPLEGLNVSENTQIAFKIASPDVGSFYHVGSTYPATINLLITSPGGAESTLIGGRDMSNLNVSAAEFYTDDPGRPGPVSLSGLQTGTYSVRAEWNQPKTFADNAKDSNSVTFSVGKRVAVGTETPTPPATTQTTAVPTTLMTPPTPPTETAVPTTVPTTETIVPTATTAPPATSPTPAPISPWAVIGALGLVIILIGRRR